MYLKNPLTKTQGESSLSHDDAKAEVPSLVNLRSINLPNAWPRFYFTHRYLLKKY